jgi:hypothetical protein
MFSPRIADKLPLKTESINGKSGGHSQNKLPSGFNISPFQRKFLPQTDNNDCRP